MNFYLVLNIIFKKSPASVSSLEIFMKHSLKREAVSTHIKPAAVNFYDIAHPYKLFTSQYISQQTSQRRFNVVFRLILRRDVAQHQINVEATFCTSTLCFSTLNWTLDNVETRLDNVETTSFSTSIFTTLSNVETKLRIWPFEKKLSLDSKTK